MNERSKTLTYQTSAGKHQVNTIESETSKDFKNFYVKKKPNLHKGKTVFNKFSSPSKFSGQKFEFMKGSDGYNVSLLQKPEIDRIDPQKIYESSRGISDVGQ